MAGEREEQFLFRVQDGALAERIRNVLREDPAARPEDAKMEVHFEGVVEHWSAQTSAEGFQALLSTSFAVSV